MTREEAIYRLKNTAWLGTDKDREEIEQAIDTAIEALQADTVEVVRCKDCKHWQKTNIETIDGHPIYDCPFCGEWADANGFCSFGERSEE